jgi:hypothetical protein
MPTVIFCGAWDVELGCGGGYGCGEVKRARSGGGVEEALKTALTSDMNIDASSANVKVV